MADPGSSAAAARVAEMLNQELRDVSALPADTAAFKSSDLPLARIKKIMKLDEDIKGLMIAAEAPLLFSKAAEILIKELTLRAWLHTERNRRRTLQRADISASVYDQDTDQFDFLIDIVPREEPPQPATAPPSVGTPSRPTTSASASAASASSSADLDATVGIPMPAMSMAMSATPTSSVAVLTSQSQLQQQQPMQYVIQLGGGGGGGAGQPMQLAFVSSHQQQQQVQQQQHSLQSLQFACTSADASVVDSQQSVDVKPDISHVAMVTSAATSPVPISFAGL